MISVIIPVLNEERALPETLACLAHQAVLHETIIVDGGSTDNTLAIAASDPQIKITSANQGRASQMNAGAQIAKGDWLLFLHADTILPDNGLALISSLPDSIKTGGFKHRFSGTAWGLKFISGLHNFRCNITRVFYGDQAMFIRKDFFHQLGGFPQRQLEDVLLGELLVKNTRPVILDAHVTTDSRKFEQNGIWLGLWRIVLILCAHTLKRPIPAQQFFSNNR